jgi:hypothetical protein
VSRRVIERMQERIEHDRRSSASRADATRFFIAAPLAFATADGRALAPAHKLSASAITP